MSDEPIYTHSMSDEPIHTHSLHDELELNIPVKLHVNLDYAVNDKEAEQAYDFLAGDTEAMLVEIENDEAKITIRFERIME